MTLGVRRSLRQLGLMDEHGDDLTGVCGSFKAGQPTDESCGEIIDSLNPVTAHPNENHSSIVGGLSFEARGSIGQ